MLHRRRWQFSLRTFLVLALAVCCFLAGRASRERELKALRIDLAVKQGLEWLRIHQSSGNAWGMHITCGVPLDSALDPFEPIDLPKWTVVPIDPLELPPIRVEDAPLVRQ